MIRRLYSNPIPGAWRDAVCHAGVQHGSGVDEIPEFDVHLSEYIAERDKHLKII